MENISPFQLCPMRTRCGYCNSKTCVKRPFLKRQKNGFQDQFSFNAGLVLQNAQGENSATLSTFIKLPFVIKIFVLSIFEWPFYTSLTVYRFSQNSELVILLGSRLTY